VPTNWHMDNGHYDFIIIGSGAGGGTLAYHLAPSGKKILLLERGPFVPREKENWNSLEVNAQHEGALAQCRRH
jgi:choline dehydrogenase-like flavoprotein